VLINAIFFILLHHIGWWTLLGLSLACSNLLGTERLCFYCCCFISPHKFDRFFYVALLFGKFRVERIYGGIRDSISNRTIQSDLHFKKLPNVIAKLVAVLGILVCMMFWYLFLGWLTCISLAYLLCDHFIGEPILKLSYRITVFMSQISNLASLLYDVKFSLETILLSTFSLEYTRVKK